MNIVSRICEKYPTEYNLMPDRRMRPIDLTFGPSIPFALQDQVLDHFLFMGGCLEPGGLPVQLDKDSCGHYALNLPGEVRYRFADRAARFYFPNYDMTTAIAWVLWIISSGKDWLQTCQGRFISCQCFSAAQQTAAARIAGSVEAQFASSIPREQLSLFLSRHQKYLDELVLRGPRFSCRPIPESVFRNLRGKNRDYSVNELAGILFGPDTFSRELKQYQEQLRLSPGYRAQLDAARSELSKIACALPIMAVSYFFTELRSTIDSFQGSALNDLQTALSRQVRFTLTPGNLSDAFEEVDRIYLDYLKALLREDFFRTVCQEAQSVTQSEIHAAKRNVFELRTALHRFCFLRDNRLGKSEQICTPLTWKQLSSLSDSDIRSPADVWDTGSFNELQSGLLSVYAPHVWICSDRLKNLSDREMIADAYNTRSAPVMDERLVWAIWVDAGVE